MFSLKQRGAGQPPAAKANPFYKRMLRFLPDWLEVRSRISSSKRRKERSYPLQGCNDRVCISAILKVTGISRKLRPAAVNALKTLVNDAAGENLAWKIHGSVSFYREQKMQYVGRISHHGLHSHSAFVPWELLARGCFGSLDEGGEHMRLMAGIPKEVRSPSPNYSFIPGTPEMTAIAEEVMARDGRRHHGSAEAKQALAWLRQQAQGGLFWHPHKNGARFMDGEGTKLGVVTPEGIVKGTQTHAWDSFKKPAQD